MAIIDSIEQHGERDDTRRLHIVADYFVGLRAHGTIIQIATYRGGVTVRDNHRRQIITFSVKQWEKITKDLAAFKKKQTAKKSKGIKR